MPRVRRHRVMEGTRIEASLIDLGLRIKHSKISWRVRLRPNGFGAVDFAFYKSRSEL